MKLSFFIAFCKVRCKIQKLYFENPGKIHPIYSYDFWHHQEILGFWDRIYFTKGVSTLPQYISFIHASTSITFCYIFHTGHPVNSSLDLHERHNGSDSWSAEVSRGILKERLQLHTTFNCSSSYLCIISGRLGECCLLLMTCCSPWMYRPPPLSMAFVWDWYSNEFPKTKNVKFTWMQEGNKEINGSDKRRKH